VFAGIGSYGYWDPQPSTPLDEDTTVSWEGGLVVGQHIGFALRRDPATDRLTPSTEPMYGEAEGRFVSSPVRGECQQPFAEPFPSSLDAFDEIVKKCNSQAVDEVSAARAAGAWHSIYQPASTAECDTDEPE
jgi:hypothetical protein